MPYLPRLSSRNPRTNNLSKPRVDQPLLASLVLFIFYLSTSVIYFIEIDFSFDEPHYILAAISIINDGDFDLKNDYQQEAYKEFYKGVLDPHVSPNTIEPFWYSIHGYGLSVILVPFIYLAKFLDTLHLELFKYAKIPWHFDIIIFYKLAISIFLSAILVVSFLLLWSAVVNSKSMTTKINTEFKINAGRFLFVFFLINPILIYSKFLSVEIIAFLFISYIFWITSLGKFEFHGRFLAPFLAGLLLWVHVKFAVISATSLLFLLYIFGQKISAKFFFQSLGIFVIPILMLLLFHKNFYGSASLNAHYSNNALSISYFIQGVLGVFFDAHTGIFFAAPIMLLLVFPFAKGENIESKNAKIYFALIATPLIIISSMHVMAKANQSNINELNFVKSWFITHNEIPMWFQTPISRFIFPLTSILSVICSLKSVKMLSSQRKKWLLISLFVISILTTYLQVLVFPHTLFRPNADFESNAPIWAFLLREWAWLAPNLLSFDYPAENILLASLWASIIFIAFYLVKRDTKTTYLLTAFSLGVSILPIKRLSSGVAGYKIDPLSMSSTAYTEIAGGSRIIKPIGKVSTDLLFGPYIYLKYGNYCVRFQIEILGTFSLLKWYISDAFSHQVLIVREAFSQDGANSIKDNLCFKNMTPHYPKEFKLYAKNFIGSIQLNGIEVEKME